MRLLLHETACQRIEAKLAALPVERLTMDDRGELRLDGAIFRGRPDPAAVWLDGVSPSPARRAFFACALSSPSLAWVQTVAAGLDRAIYAELARKGARISTSHGQAIGIAEYVLAGVLDHFQGGPERRAIEAARQWRTTPAREIMGSRWLIIGFGAIGQAVAERATAFGAEVTAARRSPKPHRAAHTVLAMDRIVDALPEADVAVLSLPLSENTRELVDTRFLSRMKPRSLLVNVSRGGLVDHAALYAALDQGPIAHAILDVFTQEPPPPDSPVWSHPRITLTAHTSWRTNGMTPRNDAFFLENLGRFLRGEPLLHEQSAEDVLGQSAVRRGRDGAA